MRALFVLVLGIIPACAEPETEGRQATVPREYQPAPTTGEEWGRVAPRDEPAAILRSGPRVAIALPRGFSIYADATVVSNTIVERGGERRVLVVFETPAPVQEVLRRYRTQAGDAGATLTLDLGGDERGSMGGLLMDGGAFAISAWREGRVTRVELSASWPSG